MNDTIICALQKIEISADSALFKDNKHKIMHTVNSFWIEIRLQTSTAKFWIAIKIFQFNFKNADKVPICFYRC